MRFRLKETRGTALLACLSALLLLTLIGSLALSNAELEARTSFYQQQEAQAVYLAEAGIHLMLYWFKHTESAPPSLRSLFLPRFTQHDESGSFINEAGISQFLGNRKDPDLGLEISHAQTFWDSSWTDLCNSLGLTTEAIFIKLYSPMVPGAVGTLESTAKTPYGAEKTITVQLIQKRNPLRVFPMKGSWQEF